MSTAAKLGTSLLRVLLVGSQQEDFFLIREILERNRDSLAADLDHADSIEEAKAMLQEGDYSLFATSGNSRELHRAALNVENSIGCIPLRKDDFFVLVVVNRHPSTELFAENCLTETWSLFMYHSGQRWQSYSAPNQPV